MDRPGSDVDGGGGAASDNLRTDHSNANAAEPQIPSPPPTLAATWIYHAFHEKYDVEISLRVFIGLCAYLSAILEWEYSLSPSSFDGFVHMYPTFTKWRCEDPASNTTSYHEWFKYHGCQSDTTPGIGILDAAKIAIIARENSYYFAFAKLSLDMIVDRLAGANSERPVTSTSPASILPAVKHVVARRTSISSPKPLIPDTEAAALLPDTGVPGLNQFQDLPDRILEGPPHHSESELRSVLGLRDKQELLKWLAQDWVVDVYREFFAAEFDQLNEKHNTSGVRGSSAKFIVNSAVIALRSGRQRYTGLVATKESWTRDDHDIRFIVQVVQRGRQQWWVRQTDDRHTQSLCAIGYRLMSWFRNVHRLNAGTSASSQRQKAVASYWCMQLRELRKQRED